MSLESEIKEELKWFGHASFLIKDKINRTNIYYLDPFDLKFVPKDKADVIFITHAHFDHFSPKDIEKVTRNDTLVFGVKGCESLKKAFGDRFCIVEPGESFEIKGIQVRTVPAYNIVKERLNFHPKENKWVGYILEVNNKKIYHAGDTDFTPEMRQLGHIDVALLPIGGTYTMTVEEATEAANVIKANVTIPIHYKRLLGDKCREAEEKLRRGVKGAVLILEECSDAGHHNR
ncbi:MAG: MBL fold metallo-hydrolase [Candidatus Aenigmarchaeota archaeon]|nr:MBL fold metallo-hydrolase [Candidatus Aenigmarchaeota archaeon]